MRIARIAGRLLVATVVFGALTIGSVSLFTEARASIGGGCICPQIYAPVKCSNGRTYTNGCYASCAHATGCVPVGPGPIEL
jgi:hypothetical protein